MGGKAMTKFWKWSKQHLWNHGFVRFIRACVQLYLDKQLTRQAAGMAYFLMLSFFPLLLCVNASLGLLHWDTAQMTALLEGVLPQISLEVIRAYLQYLNEQDALTLLLAGIVAVMTSASAAFRGMMKALCEIYAVPAPRGLRGILISLLFPLGFLLMVYLSMAVMVTGKWLALWLSQFFALPQCFALWQDLRFLLLFPVFLLFLLIMSRLPLPRGTAKLPTLLGSFLSAVALLLSSAIFSQLINLSARYSLIYGSLLSLVALMLWLYLCGNIVLAGNVLAAVYHRRLWRNALS